MNGSSFTPIHVPPHCPLPPEVAEAFRAVRERIGGRTKTAELLGPLRGCGLTEAGDRALAAVAYLDDTRGIRLASAIGLVERVEILARTVPESVSDETLVLALSGLVAASGCSPEEALDQAEVARRDPPTRS